MTILIPNNNIKEKEYTINTIFKVFLGLDYRIEHSNSKDYKIVLDNGNFLTIKDAFFSKFIKEKEYLHIANIPNQVSLLKTKFQKEIVALFGENKITIEDKAITLHADIIASTFFMLTRWEEYVIKKRDKHNRFPVEESLAYKHNFLNRPIVNEYVELLWNMLVYLGYNGKRKEHKFKMTLTHDVDVPKMWWSTKNFIKSVGSTLIKKQDFKTAFHYIKLKLQRKDPFDTFDYLMKISESHNLKSHFFFMSGGVTNKDNFYKINHPFIIKLLKNIDERGHKIGFHPSFNAYNDANQYKLELDLLNKYSPQPIKTGREHYLRFEIPTTWQIWEDHNMQWDSTMNYASKPGFRCGVCYEFPVFNILLRKQLNLREKPLIVMEGNYTTYQNSSPEEMRIDIEKIIETVRYFNGEFVFLWHNSAFNNKFKTLYKMIVDKAQN